MDVLYSSASLQMSPDILDTHTPRQRYTHVCVRACVSVKTGYTAQLRNWFHTTPTRSRPAFRILVCGCIQAQAGLQVKETYANSLSPQTSHITLNMLFYLF